MSAGSGKSWKIRCIVRVRQMLKRWRTKACLMDVPAGHMAVVVGANSRRFVIPMSHLNHPMFRYLLAKTEEEYGFTNNGLLTIPCDESLFEEIIRAISSSDPPSKAACSSSFCRIGMKKKKIGLFSESRPLLRGFADELVH
ncbi:hypothetical protein SLEP1_g31052 [Rubroshorea leprosula]|uniref:Uncharacterized protein n=1 Tax=Rubroshorea leprosula TaxID=152421 RepID=A0AAV5K998_9ROSI|nr:hypothetical protein SLEP1_g31052 [Rubroshorea leprosula]